MKNAHCANCTIGCEKILSVGDGAGKSTGRMEYESAFALGPLVGIGDRETIIRASHYCDAAGMDTISAGGHDSLGDGELREGPADAGRYGWH